MLAPRLVFILSFAISFQFARFVRSLIIRTQRILRRVDIYLQRFLFGLYMRKMNLYEYHRHRMYRISIGNDVHMSGIERTSKEIKMPNLCAPNHSPGIFSFGCEKQIVNHKFFSFENRKAAIAYKHITSERTKNQSQPNMRCALNGNSIQVECCFYTFELLGIVNKCFFYSSSSLFLILFSFIFFFEGLKNEQCD